MRRKRNTLSDCIRHSVIRRKAQFSKLDLSSFQIEFARNQEDYANAFRLLHIGYVFQGIERLGPMDMRITEQHVLPQSSVLVARQEDHLVGTVTVTQDSPGGLCLDSDYPVEMAELRSQGLRLAEIGSFSVVKRMWHAGVAPMLLLAAGRHAVQCFGASHIVAGFHPKAGAYYEAVWGFRPLGPVQQHSGLHAPIAAYVVDLEYARSHFRKHFNTPMTFGHSAYEYVFENAPWPWEGDVPSDLPPEDLARWKMPREVFRKLFLSESERVRTLSPQTYEQLRRERSDRTIDDSASQVSWTPTEH